MAGPLWRGFECRAKFPKCPVAAPSPNPPHPPALCAASGPRAAAAPVAWGGVFSLLEIGFSAGLGDPRRGARPARAIGGADPRHAVDRRGAGLPGVLRRCAPARPARRIARPPAATTAGSKGSSTPRSTPPWSCRPSSSRPRPPASAAARSASSATMPMPLPKYWNCRTRCFRSPGLCVGYPAGEGFISMRLPLAVTLHTDRYDDRGARRGDRELRPPTCRPLCDRRASSSAPPRSSATPISTAGPKTRPAKPRPSPKAAASRHTCAPAVSVSTERPAGSRPGRSGACRPLALYCNP